MTARWLPLVRWPRLVDASSRTVVPTLTPFMAFDYTQVIDELRAEESRRMVRDGYEPVLKKSRWCLLKRPENLPDKQRLRMRHLLQHNLRTVRAWLLREEFQ